MAAIPFMHEIKSAFLDTSEFDIINKGKYLDKFFIPGFLAIGGFPTCIRISTLKDLHLFNVKNNEDFEFIKSIFKEKKLLSLFNFHNELEII